MLASELQKFKNTLTARLNELERTIRNRDAATIETSADALDQIQHMTERELALETLARESSSIRETRSALRRMESGSFGMCSVCEMDISMKRLNALPWASLCIACQERADVDNSTVENTTELFAITA